MEKLGLTRDDLAAFGADSATERARRVDERLRSPLAVIAGRFLAPLSKLAGQPFAATVTLPEPTATRPEAAIVFRPLEGPGGPHFTLSITRGGVHVRLVVEREAPGRDRLAKALSRAAAALAKDYGDTELRCYDVWDGRGLPAPDAAGRAPFWKEVAARLGRDEGALDVGVGWPEARAVLLAYEDLLPAFRALSPLYRRLGHDRKAG